MTPKEQQQQVVAVEESLSASSSSRHSSSHHRHRHLDNNSILPIPTTTTSDDNNDDDNDNDNDDNAIFSFGVIADVQWADIDDGMNYAKTVKRCYRGSFRQLKSAVNFWNSYNKKTMLFNNKHEQQQQQQHQSPNETKKKPLLYIAQLGDLIDCINNKVEGESDRTLSLALQELERVSPSCPSINLVGNHELYNFNRKQLSEVDWLQYGDSEYYSFIPTKGWRVIVLDPYQIALIGHSKDDPRHIEAVELIQNENPNVSPDGAAGDWFVGIDGYQRRFCPYNGGYGSTQLSWLQNELTDAVSKKERVIIMSHVIIHPKACDGRTMAWDYEQALDIIYKFSSTTKKSSSVEYEEDGEKEGSSSSSSSNVVVAVLCGHNHNGGYYYDDQHGIHHCTFNSPLNKGDDGSAFGIIHISNECMEIVGPKINDLLPFSSSEDYIDGDQERPTEINTATLLNNSFQEQGEEEDGGLLGDDGGICQNNDIDGEITSSTPSSCESIIRFSILPYYC